MQITINDRKSFALDSQRVYTDEGFLRVPGKAARTGIQDYLACELGLKDRDPNSIVKVYRPADEVFKDESLATYLGADVTNDHPSSLVNADTYRNTSVGVVTSVGRQENDFVVVDMVIKHKDAIKAVESGKCELSAGYTAIYDDTPGMTPDGEAYDFRQTSIKINHVAIVDRARAGMMARIFDEKTGGNMPVNITLDSGRVIDVADAANAQLVADAFDRSEKRVKDAEAARDTAQALYDSALEQVAEMASECSDEAIKARVEQLSRVTTLARKVAGDAFTCDSMDHVEIMRSALTAKRPTIDWASKSAAYVEAAFDQASEKEDEEEESKDAGGNGKKRKMGDQYAQLSVDAAQVQQVSDDMLAQVKLKRSNAWKGAK